MQVLIAAAAGYLIGSIPVGLIIGRFYKGADLRDYGSGKTGFTNSLRVLGLRRSVPVFLGDFGKGALAVLVTLTYTDDPWVRAAGGFAAIVGHVWPVFAGFRGGRGLLTGAGALLALNPLAALAVVPLAGIALYLTRYVSLASITAAAVAGAIFVGLAAADVHSWAYAAAAVAGGGLVIVVHHDNIARLLSGTERKLGQTSSPPEAT